MYSNQNKEVRKVDMTAIVIAASIPSAITGFCFWLIEQNIQKRAEKERKEREARQAKVDERERAREQSELCIINCINASLALERQRPEPSRGFLMLIATEICTQLSNTRRK